MRCVLESSSLFVFWCFLGNNVYLHGVSDFRLMYGLISKGVIRKKEVEHRFCGDWRAKIHPCIIMFTCIKYLYAEKEQHQQQLTWIDSSNAYTDQDDSLVIANLEKIEDYLGYACKGWWESLTLPVIYFLPEPIGRKYHLHVPQYVYILNHGYLENSSAFASLFMYVNS